MQPFTTAPPATMASPGAESIHKLPLNAFTIRPQVRKHFDERALAGLSQSIAEQGVLYPILCYRDGDDLVVIDGERRWRASSIAGLDLVPARILEDRFTIAEALARQLSCNLQSEPLNPMEKAEGIQRFMSASGLNGKEAATKLGMEPSALCRAMGPLKLPVELRARVAAGEISADAAYQLSRLSDQSQQSALADQVASGALTRDQLAKEVQALISGRKPLALAPALLTAVPSEVPNKTASWRMTRTIAPGVALAVSGATESLSGLITVLEQFITHGREACARGIRLPKFLAEFRNTLSGGIPAAKEVRP